MVAWFIIAIATLGVFAFIAVNGVQTVASTTDGVGRIETARRMGAAVSALVARAGSPANTGRMYIMAGTTIDSVYGLPPELSMYATTPFGQRMVYCPFGDNEAGSASGAVPMGGGNTYPIETRADTTGRTYVTSGRPNLPQAAENPNLMGYLIAPRTKTSPTPTCLSVRYNATTKRFEAPDAFVRPILRSASSEDQRQQAGREVVFYVSANGTGRGLAPNDQTSLLAATGYYRANLPQSMRIIMANGNYVLPAQYLNSTVGGFSDKSNSSTLVIAGSGNTQISFDGTSDIYVPGNLELRDLTVSTAVGIWSELGHKLTLVNTSTGYLRISSGGVLNATNVTITDTRQNWALYVNDASSAFLQGTVNINAAAGLHNTISSGGSTVVFEGATLNMGAVSGGAGNLGLYAEENSDLIIKASVVNVNLKLSYALLIAGRASVTGSNFNFNADTTYAASVQNGGLLSFKGGTIGLNLAPSYGLFDATGGGITGDGVFRAKAACWYSSPNSTLFSQSLPGNATGVLSTVRSDEPVPAMSATPTASEVQNNANIMGTNSFRQHLRNVNTATYQCVRG